MRPSLALALVCASAICPVAALPGPCLDDDKTARSERLAAALERGYGVQYWGAGYGAEVLARQPHGLLILEAAQIGAPDSEDGREMLLDFQLLRSMQADPSRPLLAYLNLVELEPWRDYWADGLAKLDWTGGRTAQDEWLARYWTQSWRDVLFARIDRLMAAGADGLFLDDALHYYTYGKGSVTEPAAGDPAGPTAHAEAMMQLVLDVIDRMRLRRCDALVVVNNAVFIGRDAGAEGTALFDLYRAAIDAVLIEDAFGAADHPHLHLALAEDYLSAGVQVLSLDFAAPPAGGPSVPGAGIVALARQHGYVPYIAPGLAFDRLASPEINP